MDWILEKVIEPDLVFCTSGDITEITDEDGNKEYVPSDYPLGGIYRAYATIQLANDFPNTQILTSGGNIIDKKRYPKLNKTVARIYKEFLVKNVLSEDRISMIFEHVPLTITEITALIRYVARKEFKRVLIITNEYHIERFNEFLKAVLNANTKSLKSTNIFSNFLHSPDFKMDLLGNGFVEQLNETNKRISEGHLIISIASAEKIILSHNDSLKTRFDNFYNQENTEYLTIQKNEKRGVSQIIDGTYLPKLVH